MSLDGQQGTLTDAVSTGAGKATSRSYTKSRGTSLVVADSQSEGRSETYKPVLEERPGQLYSLQEQIYKAMATMVNQPSRHAIVKLPKKRTKNITTRTIKPGAVRDSRVSRFKDQAYNLASFAGKKIEVEEHINKRLKELKQKAIEYHDDDPDSYLSD